MSQLQEYVDSQVATISPFKVKSQELLEQASQRNLTPKKQLQLQADHLAPHRSQERSAGDHCNFDSAAAPSTLKDVLAPAEEALENISQKT